MSSASKTSATGDYRLAASSGWNNAWKIALGVGLVGLAVSIAGGWGSARFAFSYVFGFFSFLTIALGALFFVLIHYVTKAGWSVTVRRTAEFFMAGLPVFAILVIPIVLNATTLFPWMTAGHEEAAPAAAAHEEGGVTVKPAYDPASKADTNAPPQFDEATDPMVKKWYEQRAKALEVSENEEKSHLIHEKAGYLNKTFFYVRLVAYCLIWIFVPLRYWRWSVDQDKDKKVEHTADAQRFSPIAIILFGLSLTFAAFDWLMSLQPYWYSTIFGVQIFATCVVAIFSVLILFTLLMRQAGMLGEAVTTEHYHDLGKLLFGWLVFWAYVSFAQFFLIWYSNIPEETQFFHRRWTDGEGTWKEISLAIIIFHFAIPFWFLMSRNIKRRTQLLAVGAAMLLVMHWVEMYWQVLPAFPGADGLHKLGLHWLDLTCFLGVGGVYMAVVLRAMVGHSLIPIGDPRLIRALKFENA